MSEKKRRSARKRNGRLKIDLPLDEAVLAALETSPPPKDVTKKPAKKLPHPRRRTNGG